jgi:hypothetical protein
VKKSLSEGGEEKAERTRICPSSALPALKAKSTVNTESTGKRLGFRHLKFTVGRKQKEHKSQVVHKITSLLGVL